MMKGSKDAEQLHSTYAINSAIHYKHSKSMTNIESSKSNNGIGSSASGAAILDDNFEDDTVTKECELQVALKSLPNYIESTGTAKEFVCGWGAALVNITITFPINKIIFRQILHNVRVGSAYEQIKSEGILFLYRGVLPPLLQKSISTSIMFGMYENTRLQLVSYNIPLMLGNSTAAMVAGSFEALLTPFERLQTLLQDHHYHGRFKNTSHAMKIINMEYGLKEFYRGFVPIVLRNGPSNVVFFGLRDYCNATIPDSHLWYLKMMKQFMIGACIGSLISSVFYPLNVVKVHVQSRLGGPYQSISGAFKEVFLDRNRSVRALYRGVYMNCTRAFISWGIINVSYEAIKKVVYRL